MTEEIELCEDYCPADCVYMSHLRDGRGMPICYYAVLAGEARRCRISECDKYKRGARLKPRMTEDAVIYWERGVYDDDVDAFWARKLVRDDV